MYRLLYRLYILNYVYKITGRKFLLNRIRVIRPIHKQLIYKSFEGIFEVMVGFEINHFLTYFYFSLLFCLFLFVLHSMGFMPVFT